MKPLLVICPGLMKSGTTSLYHHFYTSYLLHFGHGKEHYYLNNVYQNDHSCEQYFKENFCSEKFFTFKENHQFKSFKSYYQERTLENYKNYFLEISEYYVSHKKMFYGVADFSQSYQSLSLDQIKHFRDYITEYFDVKIIRMIRDPITRLYSYCNMIVGKEKSKEYFYKVLNDPYYLTINTNFIENWSSNLWGINQSEVFIYENIFKGNDQHLQLLHEFIGIPYAPMNKKDIKLKSNYQEALNDDDIKYAKLKLRQEYAYFHNTQKLLPDSWSYANQWNIDCVKYRNLSSQYQLNPVEYY